MHHYDFHIGDFRSGCINLTRLERWIYRDLLDVCYDTEAPLPLDHSKVAKLIGLRTEEEKQALEIVLDEKFQQTADGYINTRAHETIARYKRRCEINAENKKKNESSTNRQRIVNESSTTLVNQLTSKPINQLTSNQSDRVDQGLKKQDGVTSPQADIATTPFFDFAKEMRSDLQAEATATGKKYALPTDAGLRGWANQIRLCVLIDGRTLDEIRQIWQWARQDSFWATNIRSADKLRKQFDQLVANKERNRAQPTSFAAAGAYQSRAPAPKPKPTFDYKPEEHEVYY